MRTIIYYFSATGNSLALARKLAGELDDTELISIPQVWQQPVIPNTDRIGLIFPVYAWGMPRIVTDFLRQLRLHKGQYVFAIATCGGVPGGALRQLEKMVRRNGGKLAAGFTVKEASHVLLGGGNPLMTIVRKIAQPIAQTGTDRLTEILAIVKNNQTQRPETSSWFTNLVAGSFHGLALQAFKTGDQNYWVTEACTGCGICERVCPRNNIHLKDHRPAWNHNCELCFGCAQWCPSAAIEYQTGSVGKTRSHHQDIGVNDVLLR